MDNFLGLPDKLHAFSSFLTVTTRFKYICLHIFNILYRKKSYFEAISQAFILSQCQSHFSPASMDSSNVLAIVSNIFKQDATIYIPRNNFWLNRPF